MDVPVTNGIARGGHTPVLARIVRETLRVRPGEVIVDATLGLGGHARLFAEDMGPTGTLIGLDVDPLNLEHARSHLLELPGRIEIVPANFTELPRILAELGWDRIDVLFADLGVSSTQLDQAERGFSFLHDGPLDMRLDPRTKLTAADLVNRLSERELADIFYYNAQETAGRRIARYICQHRREGRITTTGRLAAIVAEALGVDPQSRKSKTHPATRTFLALRMAVNNEKRNLEAFLDFAPELLRAGGRFGIIAFHSVEDKPIKLDFRKRKNERIYDILTKKPIVADATERRENPRSRSAKFRAVVRL